MNKKTEESKQEETKETKEKKETDEKLEEQVDNVQPVEKVVEKVIEVNVDYKDQYLRLVAEFDNARKRMERDKQDFIKFANEGLITELLSVIDHLELSVKAAQMNPEDTKNLIKGIEMVLVNAQELLKKNGVAVITSEGQKFDPNCHEILSQEPSEEDEGTILEEMQRGYKYHDRVLRTAKVKVAKNN